MAKVESVGRQRIDGGRYVARVTKTTDVCGLQRVKADKDKVVVLEGETGILDSWIVLLPRC